MDKWPKKMDTTHENPGERHQKMDRMLPADIIFTPGMGAIRLFQTAPGEDPTWAGHVAGLGTPSMVVEAKWKVVSTAWDKYRERTPAFEVWRHTGLTMEQREAVAAVALGFMDESVHYGWWKLGLHLGDWGLAWARWGLTAGQWEGEAYALRRLMFSDEFPICNWVWAKAYQEAIGYRFGVKAAWTTPDTMHDHVLLHSRSAVHELPVLHKKLCEKKKGGDVIQLIPDAAGVWEMVCQKTA